VRRIESHRIPGPAGELEALLEEPEDREPTGAALVCHPHPLYGGTMHNKVVHRLARGLRGAGNIVLRFNFRGVGTSQGEHAHGTGEIDDALAALAWLKERYPGLPVQLAGFSFGARVVLNAGCRQETGAVRLIATGLPSRGVDLDMLASCTVPKVFIHSTHDEHGPRIEMERIFAQTAEPKRIVWIEARDHFFVDGLEELERAAREL
jgi:uncharacterized protein